MISNCCKAEIKVVTADEGTRDDLFNPKYYWNFYYGNCMRDGAIERLYMTWQQAFKYAQEHRYVFEIDI